MLPAGIKVNTQRCSGPSAAMCIYAVHATGSELNAVQSVLAVCSRTGSGTVLTEASADFAYTVQMHDHVPRQPS